MGRLQELLKEIKPINQNMCEAAQKKWDEVGKPLRSLGKLEDMVIQLAGITGKLTPQIDQKACAGPGRHVQRSWLARNSGNRIV